MLLFYRMLRIVTLKCLTKRHFNVWESVVHGVICTSTHSERRPQNIYSQEEINLYCIIKLATEMSLFSLQISKTWCFGYLIDKIKFEHLAILSNLKSCQFAHRIVIFNLCICCQFVDSQIISPKIIPMNHRSI